jgi:hypothetical protein
VEAANAVDGSTKQRQSKAIVFFIIQILFFPRPFTARVDEPEGTKATPNKRGSSQADRLKNTPAFRQSANQRYPKPTYSIQPQMRIPRPGTAMAP